jgi:hypothetical protein
VVGHAAEERPDGPNILSSQIKEACPVELVALFSLTQHGTETNNY